MARRHRVALAELERIAAHLEIGTHADAVGFLRSWLSKHPETPRQEHILDLVGQGIDWSRLSDLLKNETGDRASHTVESLAKRMDAIPEHSLKLPGTNIWMTAFVSSSGGSGSTK